MEALIMERLGRVGVPRDFVDRQQSGLVDYVKDNQGKLEEIIAEIFPSDKDVVECLADPKTLFKESMIWLRYLMFMGDPEASLEQLSQFKRSICGEIFEEGDSVYRCHTCGLDPTNTICVDCFNHGDHKGHEFLITGVVPGGCCDCGDVGVWKQDGFCSKHKGTEHIQTLPSEFANSMGPIFDKFFCFWRDRLEGVSDLHPHIHVFEESLTDVVVELLLEFFEKSECLLSFIAEKLSVHSLMKILVRVDRQISLWSCVILCPLFTF